MKEIIEQLKNEIEVLKKLTLVDESADDKIIKSGADFAKDAAQVEIQEAISHLTNAIHFLDEEKKVVKYEDIPDYD